MKTSMFKLPAYEFLPIQLGNKLCKLKSVPMSLQIRGHMESHLKHAGQLAPLTNCEIFRSKVGRFPPGFQRKKGQLSNFKKSILNGKDYTNQIPHIT